MDPRRFSLLAACFLLGMSVVPSRAAATVSAQDTPTLMRVPQGGVQPKIVADAEGVLHLVYLAGTPKAAEVWYARREKGARDFGRPVRVNSIPGSALAIGTIRGAKVAVGPDGGVGVVWNGSGTAERHAGSPLWFSRRLPDGTFSTHQDVIRSTDALDGGGAIAAGRAGEFRVFWHSNPTGSRGEASRRVFAVHSRDGGRTFGPEVALDDGKSGVCGCCGIEAAGAADGRWALVYRSARALTHREAVLLWDDGGVGGPVSRVLEDWEIATCPMSSAAVRWEGKRIRAGWETRGEVRFAELDPATRTLGPIWSPTREPGLEPRARKHPTLVDASPGEVLAVWVEGTGWERGGEVAWQTLARDGRPGGMTGRRDGVPVWGFAAGFPSGDSVCGILY